MAHRLLVGLLATLLLVACASQPSTITPTLVTSEAPIDPISDWKLYTNTSFGLSIRFPPDWQGPVVHEYSHGLRFEVGSDVVYPDWIDPVDRVYNIKDSYYVVIRYAQNNSHWDLEQYVKNQPWIENYLALLEIKDGESISGIRDLFVRVAQVEIAGFEGLEYIQTLSDTAQAEWFYARYMVLFDQQLNNLTVIGIPNNVEILDRSQWRDAYRQVDEANLEVLHKILRLIAVE